MRIAKFLTMLALIESYCASNLALAQTQFAITDLGANVVPHGINDLGQIAGSFSTPSGVHPFLYSNGIFNDLGTLGGTGAGAMQINSHGQIVGYSMLVGDSSEHAFVYSLGAMTDLGTISGDYSFAFDIGENGNVVGQASAMPALPGQVTVNHAFLYSSGQMQDLGSLVPPGKLGFSTGNSTAIGINQLGQIAGYSTAPSGGQHAFLYSNGNMQDLSGPTGYVNSYAFGINNGGEIVAEALVNSAAGNNSLQLFSYRNGMMTILNSQPTSDPALVLANAGAINDDGQIVWTVVSPSLVDYYSDATGIVDLNSAIDPSSGWTLSFAYDINNSGQIVGTGTLNGETHGYLLTPIPEPSTFLLCLLALGGVIEVRRKSIAILMHPTDFLASQ
jgi:probable HAF family extracellular repeat protein